MIGGRTDDVQQGVAPKPRIQMTMSSAGPMSPASRFDGREHGGAGEVLGQAVAHFDDGSGRSQQLRDAVPAYPRHASGDEPADSTILNAWLSQNGEPCIQRVFGQFRGSKLRCSARRARERR